MNHRAMTKLKPHFASLFLLLAACTQPAQTDPQSQGPLAGSSIGGPFTLVGSAGETVKWSDFEGKYRIVYFGYSYCPDACPFDVQRMMQGYARFKQAEPEMAAQVQPIFISIVPERDTPEVVGEFASAFSDDLMGLTGTPEQVAQAAKAFSVYYQKGEVTKNGGYLMDHSRGAYLMGRKGEPIALLPIDAGPDAVAAELARWTS
jgi:protein SCO1/2